MGKVKGLDNFQMRRNMSQSWNWQRLRMTPAHQPVSQFSIPSAFIVCSGIHQWALTDPTSSREPVLLLDISDW